MEITGASFCGTVHTLAMARPKSPGYTLVELVLVLVLVGVIAAIALPRFFDLQVFQQRGFSDVALSAVRFAQKHAVATGCNVRIQFSAAGFSVTANPTAPPWPATCSTLLFGTAVLRPTGSGAFSENAPSGVVVTAADLYFDAAGRPRNPTTGGLLTIPVNVSIGSRTLVIEPESGYVHSP